MDCRIPVGGGGLPEARACHRWRESTADLVTEHRYTSFSAMLKDMEAVVEVRKGEYDQQVRLR